MYRTIYLSAASHMFSTEDLNAILSVSRRNNQSDGISGDLLPFESAVVSSLCSVFGPLLTVGDTPTE